MEIDPGFRMLVAEITPLMPISIVPVLMNSMAGRFVVATPLVIGEIVSKSSPGSAMIRPRLMKCCVSKVVNGCSLSPTPVRSTSNVLLLTKYGESITGTGGEIRTVSLVYGAAGCPTAAQATPITSVPRNSLHFIRLRLLVVDISSYRPIKED